jgi:hypothetical protein
MERNRCGDFDVYHREMSCDVMDYFQLTGNMVQWRIPSKEL